MMQEEMLLRNEQLFNTLLQDSPDALKLLSGLIKALAEEANRRARNPGHSRL